MAAASELLSASRSAWLAMLANSELQPDLSPDQSHDLFLSLQHGLTALHQANEPHLVAGEGRFGGLIDAAIGLFAAGWSSTARPPQERD